MISVTIPTLKTREQIQPLIDEIRKTYDGEIIASCIYQSAAKNRNWCIDNASNDIIVQLDDDISGFYIGWVDELVSPLVADKSISIAAARLVNDCGKQAPMMGGDDPISGDLQIAKHRLGQFVCSACIAFRKSDGVRFDEDYKSAVCEDTQFCLDYRKKYPEKNIVINNNVRLIHHNEMKRINRADVKDNFELFYKKNGVRLV